MPKEIVQGTLGDNHEFRNYEVRVGWLNDCDVQIGVETSDGRSLVSMLYGDPNALRRIGQAVLAEADQIQDASLVDAQQFGRWVLNHVEASVTNPNDSYTGVHVFLTRQGINRLIKVLRRARDAAYGHDE